MNRAFCEILGTDAERLRAATFADVVHPEDRPSAWSLVAERDYDADRPARGRETRLLHAAGHVVWGELRISPVPGPKGTTDCAIVHLLDVSEARRSEEALRHRVAIENLVATISSKFVHAESRLIDDTIREALPDIGRCTGVNRSELFLFSADGTIQGASHAWLADGSEAFAGSLPDVLGDPTGAEDDSHAMGLLEYPHYTRPLEFRGWKVPEVLLTGAHAKIDKWRREQALLRTLKKRPDMFEKAELTKADLKFSYVPRTLARAGKPTQGHRGRKGREGKQPGIPCALRVPLPPTAG